MVIVQHRFHSRAFWEERRWFKKMYETKKYMRIPASARETTRDNLWRTGVNIFFFFRLLCSYYLLKTTRFI